MLQGISAVVNDELLVGPEYVFRFDTATWGWIHILIAILLGAGAIGMMVRGDPVWSIVVIALDIVVIWAVATWERYGSNSRGR